MPNLRASEFRPCRTWKQSGRLHFQLLLVGVAASLVAACAPSTVLQLKGSAAPIAFSLDTNYQLSFRKLKSELSRCVIGGFLMAKSDIDAQLYPDIGIGEIAVRFNNMGDKSVFVQVEFSARGTSTEVVAYSADIGIWNGYSRKIQRFFEVDAPLCED